MSEVLGAWPVMAVILNSPRVEPPHPKSDQLWDNSIAALESEQYNRICESTLLI